MLRSLVVLLIACACYMPRILHAGYEDGVEAASKGAYKKALAEFQKAAEKGDVRAQYSLGIMYYDGVGVKKNHDSAIKWLKKAAEQGHPAARQILKSNQ